MSVLVENKKARFDFELIDTLEAGMDLRGFEVKALRQKKGSLKGSHVIIRGNEAFLVGFDLPPYQPKNTPEGYEQNRNRKLLLSKKEIGYLQGKEKEKGFAVVPVSIILKNNKIKLNIAVGKGKKKHDKREVIKDRDAKRDMERAMKRNY